MHKKAKPCLELEWLRRWRKEYTGKSDIISTFAVS